ncbi:MAG: cytochrome c [Vicinamibacterales bacterium]|nr:cytochrome c [Vicinamibacterales bacterium]
MRSSASIRRAALVLAAVAVLAGCRQDMHDTPRYEPFEASTFFADGRASRAYPIGTVARGQLRADDHLYTGRVNGEFAETFPFAVSHAEMARGQQRYNVYCAPCHGQIGDGNGMVVQRGLRQAATYHQDRLRGERIGYFYDVITNGFGAMQGYAEQVPVRDRWLIAAYIRALQLSQHAPLEAVRPGDRPRLDQTPEEQLAPPPTAATGH